MLVSKPDFFQLFSILVLWQLNLTEGKHFLSPIELHTIAVSFSLRHQNCFDFILWALRSTSFLAALRFLFCSVFCFVLLFYRDTYSLQKVWKMLRRTQIYIDMGFLCGSGIKNLPTMIKNLQETQVQPVGSEDPLEEGMATHSIIIA